MLARGLSVRDIEDAFKDETGRLLLSKTAISEIGKQLWEDRRQNSQQFSDLTALSGRSRDSTWETKLLDFRIIPLDEANACRW